MLMFYLSLLDTPEEKDKFEHIYSNYRGLMLYTAYHKLGDYQLAEDVVHDVCLKLIDHIESVRMDSPQKLRAFLVRITTNQAVDYWRVTNKHEIPRAPEDISSPNNVSEMNPDDAVIEFSQASRMIQLIRNLDETYRAPLSLKIYGYSISEIASFLGISESNVKVRIHRGRQKILSLLSNEGSTHEHE